MAAAKTRRSHFTTTALTILLALAGFTAAASTNTLDPGIPPDPNPLEALMDGLVGKYGWITTVVLIIGSLRIVFKPLMLALENYVRQTPSTTDDARLAKFESGLIYRIISFLLDFGASIKLPNRNGTNQ